VARAIKGKNGGTLMVLEKGETANPNGRPKTYLNQLKEELEIECDIQMNKSTAREFLRMLAYLPKDKVIALAVNDKMPVAIRLFAKSIIKDWGQSSTDTVKGLISFEMGAGDSNPNIPTLSDIEPQKILDTSKYLVAMLDMTLLETFCNWLEEHVDKKRAGEAKIIEG